MKCIVLIFSLFSINTVYSQYSMGDFLKEYKSDFLKDNKLNKEITYNIESKSTGCQMVKVKYLGRINSSKNRTLKIIRLTQNFGNSCDSPRANSFIIVFNSNNQYLGNYYVGSISSLPDKIENDSLIFKNTFNNNCDATTAISFRKKLPAEMFVECKEGRGDIYVFSSN